MRYSPLDASYRALQPAGVCPTLPSFVKVPKSLVCGVATAMASAITMESVLAGTNDLPSRTISASPDRRRARLKRTTAIAHSRLRFDESRAGAVDGAGILYHSPDKPRHAISTRSSRPGGPER